MTTDDRYDYLAHFLGPKGENAEQMEALLTTILRDHVHWRRNYFPQDPPLLPPSRRRALETGHDRLEARVGTMIAALRRNFPFFSPRYIGHQLSDVSMPALLGYFAGMLYNPNNVTSEASPVTAGWEQDACSAVLEMLGYPPPPAPPTTWEELSDYERRLQEPFGYAHITSGGTVANIEALWVARNVRYGVLAIKDAAAEAGVTLPVTLPDGTGSTTADTSHGELLQVHPDEAVALTGRLVEIYSASRGIEAEKASQEVLRLAERSPYHLRQGWARCATDFPRCCSLPALPTTASRKRPTSSASAAGRSGGSAPTSTSGSTSTTSRPCWRRPGPKDPSRSRSWSWRARPKREQSTPCTRCSSSASAGRRPGSPASGRTSTPRGAASSGPSSASARPHSGTRSPDAWATRSECRSMTTSPPGTRP